MYIVQIITYIEELNFGQSEFNNLLEDEIVVRSIATKVKLPQIWTWSLAFRRILAVLWEEAAGFEAELLRGVHLTGRAYVDSHLRVTFDVNDMTEECRQVWKLQCW